MKTTAVKNNSELEATVRKLAVPGKGILAADESQPTITKRFATIDLDSTEENRRAYRSLLFATPGISDFVSGVILYEETLEQSRDDGKALVDVLSEQGIVPGIKVDKGKGPLANISGDMISFGLDGLEERLARYRELGARFAKWRSVYPITEVNPTSAGIQANAEVLARYAAACQAEAIVPIVEPEVLIDGSHPIGRTEVVAESVLDAVFNALRRHRVVLEHMILKPAMVTPGREYGQQAAPDEVADATLRVLRRSVPAAVPGISFLSGGQSPKEATSNLDAINRRAEGAPWLLSFSYGRALQEPVIATWRGQQAQVEAAQRAFYHRAELNSAAARGAYSPDLEIRGT